MDLVQIDQIPISSAHTLNNRIHTGRYSHNAKGKMPSTRLRRRKQVLVIGELAYIFIMMIMISLFNTLFNQMFIIANERSRKHPSRNVNKERIAVGTRKEQLVEDYNKEDKREIFFPVSSETDRQEEYSENAERPRMCDKCFKHKFDLIIDNRNICSTLEGREPVEILILITSVHSRVHQRDAIRKTWLTPTKNNTGNVRYAFLFGLHKTDSRWEDALKIENEANHDILPENFIDAYRNLTYKTIMGLRWANISCPQAKYVMKTDDDMYVNIHGLLKAVQKHSAALQTAIGGKCPSMAMPIRKKTSKWFVDYKLYPKNIYPQYCSGTGYVTSRGVVKSILEIYENVPFFPIEDIYISFCIQLLNYRFETIRSFNGHFVSPDNCVYKSPGFATSHKVSKEWMYAIWNDEC